METASRNFAILHGSSWVRRRNILPQWRKSAYKGMVYQCHLDVKHPHIKFLMSDGKTRAKILQSNTSHQQTKPPKPRSRAWEESQESTYLHIQEFHKRH
eukprot:3175542-Amphidinium_carterae.1